MKNVVTEKIGLTHLKHSSLLLQWDAVVLLNKQPPPPSHPPNASAPVMESDGNKTQLMKMGLCKSSAEREQIQLFKES